METITAKLEQSGRLLLPADWRRKMNLEPGMEIMLRFDEAGIHVLGSRKDRLRLIQKRLSAIAPERVLSEELIEERRREAAIE